MAVRKSIRGGVLVERRMAPVRAVRRGAWTGELPWISICCEPVVTRVDVRGT